MNQTPSVSISVIFWVWVDMDMDMCLLCARGCTVRMYIYALGNKLYKCGGSHFQCSSTVLLYSIYAF